MDAGFRDVGVFATRDAFFAAVPATYPRLLAPIVEAVLSRTPVAGSATPRVGS